MILTGSKIESEVENEIIVIKPFNKKNITTNSYDLSLGKEYLVYTDEILDPKRDNKFEIKKFPSDGLVLKKGDFILCSSNEVIGSIKYVPLIHAKSSIARLGLFVHITADLIDIGSLGQVTFQLYATRKVRIYSNMLIGQVSFWKVDGEIKLYDGKYQGSKGPQASKSWRD